MSFDIDETEYDVEDLEQHGLSESEQNQQVSNQDWDAYYAMENQAVPSIDQEVEDYLGGQYMKNEY